MSTVVKTRVGKKRVIVIPKVIADTSLAYTRTRLKIMIKDSEISDRDYR